MRPARSVQAGLANRPVRSDFINQLRALEYRKFGNTGLKVSYIGLGGGPFGSLYGDTTESDVVNTVFTAFDNGINFFDTAPSYGDTLSESRLGTALKQLPRDQFILSTKTGKYKSDEFGYTYDRILREVELSMKRLNVDYIDILSLHDFEFRDGVDKEIALSDGIRALQHLKAQGKIRFFGTAIYFVDWIIEAINNYEIETAICHNHNGLNDDRLNDLLPAVREKGIGLIGASPLAMGLLTHGGPSVWHPAEEDDLKVFRKAVDHCDKVGMPIEQLAIQHTFSHKEIPVTIVGVKSPNEILQNLEWSRQAPDPQMVSDVKDILKPVFNKDWIVG